MSRRTGLVLLLAAPPWLAGCGRQGPLRLPDEAPPAERPADSDANPDANPDATDANGDRRS